MQDVEQLVRAAPLPALVLDLASGRIVEVSDAAAEVFGAERRDQLVGKLTVTFSADKQASADALALLSNGKLDAYRTPRRLRRVDGEEFDAWLRLQLVPDSTLALLLIDVDVDGPIPIREVRAASGPTALGIVDETWCTTVVSVDVEELLGVSAAELQGEPILVRVHADDVPDLLLLAAQALRTRRGASTLVRLLGGDGSWRLLRLSLSLLRQDGKLLAGFVLEGLTPAPAEEAPALTERQEAIVELLLTGARVSTIARELHLSQGTVRNHLVTLFRRYGVHSQAELVEALRTSA